MNRKASLARRICEVRRDLYGEYGTDTLATALKIPSQTWCNYERGVTMPADIMLEFLNITGTDPHWLLTGEGERSSAHSF